MLFNSKKISNLNNIYKLLSYVPKVFILIVGIVLFTITYLILESNKKRDLNLLNQDLILHYEFKQRDILYDFVQKVNKKIKNEFLNDKSKLEQIIHKNIGYIQAKYTSDINSNKLFIYLNKIEKEENIKIILFEENLNILYGQDSINKMQEYMFNHKNTHKYKKLLLQYIYSQQKNNLQLWKYNSQKSIILSFFDILEIKNKRFFLGAISSENNIRQSIITNIKNSIKSKDKIKDYKIWLYDFINKKTFNYSSSDIKRDRFNVLKYYTKNEKENINLKKYVYLNTKYSYLLSIDYNPNYILDKNLNQKEIKKKYKEKKYESMIYISILTFILMLFSFIFSRYMQKIFEKYNKQLKEKTEDLEKHKNQMEILVSDEVKKNQKKDSLLIQQNKLASMGSMLENIAHQWRQPLNNVNLILHYLKDNYDNVNFNKEILHKYINKAKVQIDYMSHTINDFRDFYKPSKEINHFNISKIIDNTLQISSQELNYENIEIKLKLNNIFIVNYENELKQTILNILNNAKDAIILKRIRKKSKFTGHIKITVKKNKKFVLIMIENNGGKIKKDIIDKIFDPYFTTRSKTLGTGIGLYMVKVIIQKNMKGKIKVKNIKGGVRFSISLPFDLLKQI
jgi:signal transduction histidine kinase